MKNMNMARYYAWANLSAFIKKSYRKYFFTPYYKFHYVQPKVRPDFMLNPFHKWKANRQRDQTHYKLIILSLAFLAFAASNQVYKVLYDEDQGYFYHTQYPVICKVIEAFHADFITATTPFFDIFPKNRYEYSQVYPRLYELIFKTTQKIQQKDLKVLQLRKQIEEYDRTHK